MLSCAFFFGHSSAKRSKPATLPRGCLIAARAIAKTNRAVDWLGSHDGEVDVTLCPCAVHAWGHGVCRYPNVGNAKYRILHTFCRLATMDLLLQEIAARTHMSTLNNNNRKWAMVVILCTSFFVSLQMVHVIIPRRGPSSHLRAINKPKLEKHLVFHINISFPYLPCAALSMDVMDVMMGRHESDLRALNKTRIMVDANNKGVSREAPERTPDDMVNRHNNAGLHGTPRTSRTYTCT